MLLQVLRVPHSRCFIVLNCVNTLLLMDFGVVSSLGLFQIVLLCGIFHIHFGECNSASLVERSEAWTLLVIADIALEDTTR